MKTLSYSAILLLAVTLSASLHAQNAVKVEAENMTSKSSKVEIKQRQAGPSTVNNFFGGAWLKFGGLDFGEGVSKVRVRYAGGKTAEKVAGLEIRLGSRKGEVIATIALPGKGWGNYQETEVDLSRKVTNKQDVFILSTGGGSVLDWFEFKE